MRGDSAVVGLTACVERNDDDDENERRNMFICGGPARQDGLTL